MRRVLLIAAILSAPAAAAQERGEDALERCETGRIGHVFIDNHSIFDTSDPDLDRRLAWAYRLANRLHVRTRESVIRRELLLGRGDCFDPALAEESERLLRSLDFLSHVDVFGVPQDDGNYHLVVDTQDEWSTRVDVRLRFDNGFGLRGAALRELNLLGTGQQVGVHFFEHRAIREYGISYRTPQLGGTRWNLDLGGGGTRAGTFVHETIAFPFVGDVGRWSARQSFQRRDRHFDFVREMPEQRLHVLVPVRDKTMDMSVMTRIGPQRNITLLGAAMTFQELTYPGGRESIQVTRGDFDELTAGDSAIVAEAWDGLREVRNVRGFLLFGQRNIWWLERRGLDSMQGEQDVQLGAEVQVGIGRSLPTLQEQDDLYGIFRLYTGLQSATTVGAIRVRVEARRDFEAPADASEWEDVLTEGELLAYWQPRALRRHTLLLRASAVGGWHTRTPFQLTLGGDAALRGYHEDRFPGARRLVFSAEDRIYFGWPFTDLLDIGGTVFGDFGRIWPGDVPYGVASGWRGTAGIGLRGSFPAGSRTTYRIDVAFPLGGGEGWRSPRLVISLGESLGLVLPFADPQMLRSRRNDVFGDQDPQLGRR